MSLFARRGNEGHIFTVEGIIAKKCSLVTGITYKSKKEKIEILSSTSHV